MVRRISVILLGILFAFVLLFNVYLLFGLVGGARVVREAEAVAGHALNCFELYETRSIEAYFYPERARQGDTIYLSAVMFPFWLGVSIGLPFALTAVLGRRKRWHWLPLILITLLLLPIGAHLGVLGKLVCALE
jgi:hypothetical protein